MCFVVSVVRGLAEGWLDANNQHPNCSHDRASIGFHLAPRCPKARSAGTMEDNRNLEPGRIWGEGVMV